MWRSFFLALGITSVIAGVECTIVDKVFMAERPKKAPAAAIGFGTAPEAAPKVRELPIPDWAPWSLMSTGAVVILYSFTIPKRVSGG